MEAAFGSHQASFKMGEEKIISLAQELSSLVLPIVKKNGAGRLLLGTETRREFISSNSPLPENVKVVSHPLQGRRTAEHGARIYSNQSVVAATWPEDAMVATRVPILIFTLRGAADMRVGDYLLHCPAHHFLLVPSGIPRFDGSRSHLDGERRRDDYCALLWLLPLYGGLESWVCYSRGERHWSHQIGETALATEPQSLGYFLSLVQEVRTRPPGWENTCQSLMCLLYVSIWRAAKENNGPSRWNCRIPTEHTSWDPIALARHYALQHLQNAPSLDDIARVVCLSRSEFTRRFRQETGQSFNAWLTTCRIEEARRLLADTDWSIVAVAFHVGLKPSRLRDLFYEHEKRSPQEYRFQTRETRIVAEKATQQ